MVRVSTAADEVAADEAAALPVADAVIEVAGSPLPATGLLRVQAADGETAIPAVDTTVGRLQVTPPPTIPRRWRKFTISSSAVFQTKRCKPRRLTRSGGR